MFDFYRVTKEFEEQLHGVRVIFNVNTRWRLIGEVDEQVKLTRDNVYIWISKRELETHFESMAK